MGLTVVSLAENADKRQLTDLQEQIRAALDNISETLLSDPAALDTTGAFLS